MRVLRIEQLKPGRDANIKVQPFSGDIAQGLKPEWLWDLTRR
jgi:hypothetical protein